MSEYFSDPGESCINYDEEDTLEMSANRIPTSDFDYNFLHLLDHKIEIEYEGEICVGNLWWCGINPLHGKYQVTLNRTPYWPVDPKTIKLYDSGRTRIHEG